jgi:hypothetical protein
MPHENAGQQFRRVEGQGTVRSADPATNVLSTDRHAGGADIVPIKFTGAGDALAGTAISDNGWQNRIF